MQSYSKCPYYCTCQFLLNFPLCGKIKIILLKQHIVFPHFAEYSKETASDSSAQGNNMGLHDFSIRKSFCRPNSIQRMDIGKSTSHKLLCMLGGCVMLWFLYLTQIIQDSQNRFMLLQEKHYTFYDFLHIFTRGATKYGGWSRRSHTLINKVSPQEALLST